MEKLKISLDRELQTMIDLGISAEEWILIQLLFLCVEENKPEYLFRYFTEAKKEMVPKKLLESLKEKGIIDKSYIIPKEGEKFDPSEIILSEKFAKKYFKSSLDQGLELLNNFPPFIVGKNGSYPIKNFSKFWRTMEDFCFAYGKAIKFSPSKHKEILELLEWAIENNLITFNIAEFVISQKWEDLKKMRDSGDKTYLTPQVFDTSQLI